MGWVIFLIFIFIVFMAAVSGKKASEKSETNFQKKYDLSADNLLVSGTYTCGHPKIDKPIDGTKMLLLEYHIKIFEYKQHNSCWTFRGEIPKEDVSNITVEDATTIQSRVGIKRMLLVGLFAFAWKKKVKTEIAYLVIEWKTGKFANETIFEFTGKSSMSDANTLRNNIIKFIG